MGKSIDWKQVIRYAGAIIAFGIGSGFATGQEVMQFFTAYGFKSILTCVVFLVIIIYANCSFAAAGYYEKLQKGSKVYEFYGGPIIGKFFDYFTVLFCYMSFVVMVSGASATFAQQFGFPKLVGGVVIAVLAGIAVVFGLNSLVDVISKIGPVIIVFTVFIAVTALVLTGSHLSEGAALLESGEIEILKGGSNWFTAGISYAGFALMWFAGFLAQLGSTAKRKTIYTGIVVGQLVTTLTGLIAGFALLANIVDVADAQIPNLALANKIFPAWIGVLFALIIFIAIFSSATPLLWTAVARFADERTNRYNILTAVLVVIGCVIAFLVPFNTLVNYIYVINGYAGFVLVLLMLIKDIRVAGARKAIKAQEKD